MSKNIRIVYDNLYNDSTLQDQDNTNVYKEDTANDRLLNGELAKTSNRTSVLATNLLTTYTLGGQLRDPSTISCLAFVRANVKPTSTVSFTVWDYTDWADDYTDNTNFTYQIDLGGIGVVPGWGDFNWGDPWGGNRAYIGDINPMASVQIMWFDRPGVKIWSAPNVQAVFPAGEDIFLTNITNWRIDIHHITGGVPHHEQISIDRIFIGAHMPIEYNISHGHSITFADSSKTYRTEAGSLVSVNKKRFKNLKYVFSVISPKDRTTLAKFLAIIGKHVDILVSVYPLADEISLEVDYSLVGKLKKIPILRELIGGYYKTTVDIEET